MKEESDGTTYPYVRGMLGWGIFCHHSDTPTVTREVGEVICRQSHREFLSIISHTSTKPASYSGGYYDGTIHCSGTESFLSECEVTVTPQILCPEGYTTVNCASGLLINGFVYNLIHASVLQNSPVFSAEKNSYFPDLIF